jgi:hypothetical protein
MSNTTDSMINALGLTLVAATLAACGPEAGEPVDEATTRDAITANTELISTRMITSYRFLAESEVFSRAVDGALVGESECWGGVDESGQPFEECAEPEPVDVDAELDAGTDALQALLTEVVFTDANVESSSGTELVYLMRGANVCADLEIEEADAYAECVTNVDTLEVRLAVTSPAAGDVSIDVLVGPDRHNPFTFDVWQDRIAAEVDLGGIRDTVVFGAEAMGEEAPDLPESFDGRARLELRSPSADVLTVEASVLRAIAIADAAEGWDVRVAQAQPAATLTADAAAQTLTADVAWGAIDAVFPAEFGPSEEHSSGVEVEEEEPTRHVFDLHVGGATGQAVFTVGQEVLALTGLGLGADTTTLDVDGARVFALDINPDDGRAFDVTLSEVGEALRLAFAPKLDLRATFALGLAPTAFADVDPESWMIEDTLSVLLGGADPTIELGEQGVRVVSGELTLASTSAGVSHTAAAGQCMIGEDVEASASCAPAEPGAPDQPACEEPEVEASHPFEGLSVGVCE